MELFHTSIHHTAGDGHSCTPGDLSPWQYSRAMLDVNGEKRLKCFAKSYPFSGFGGGACDKWESKWKVLLNDAEDLDSSGVSCPLAACRPCDMLPEERLCVWVHCATSVVEGRRVLAEGNAVNGPDDLLLVCPQWEM